MIPSRFANAWLILLLLLWSAACSTPITSNSCACPEVNAPSPPLASLNAPEAHTAVAAVNPKVCETEVVPSETLVFDPAGFNQHGFRGLMHALSEEDIDSIELSHCDGHDSPMEMNKEDQHTILRILRASVLWDSGWFGIPEWNIKFLFHTQEHGTYAVIYIPLNAMRLALQEPSDAEFCPHERVDITDRIRPTELTLNDPEFWFHDYLEKRFGQGPNDPMRRMPPPPYKDKLKKR